MRSYSHVHTQVLIQYLHLRFPIESMLHQNYKISFNRLILSLNVNIGELNPMFGMAISRFTDTQVTKEFQ